jgi:hypothetical protein
MKSLLMYQHSFNMIALAGLKPVAKRSNDDDDERSAA